MDENIARRLTMMESLVSEQASFHNLRKIHDIYKAIMEVIEEVDPQANETILKRMREINSTNIPIKPRRTGFFRRVKDHITSFFYR